MGCLTPYLANEADPTSSTTTTATEDLGRLAAIQGDWMACIGTTGIWIKVEKRKVSQAFVSYAGPGCTGAYVISPDGSGNPVITEPVHVGDFALGNVTDFPSDFFIARMTNINSIAYDCIIYPGSGFFYELVPTAGPYSSGNTTAEHASWSNWLANEVEVAGFVADPTGYSPGAGFLRLQLVSGVPQ